MSRCYWFFCSMLLIPIQSTDAFADHRDYGLSTSNSSAVQVRRQPRVIINREEQERQTGIVENAEEADAFPGAERKAGIDLRANIIQAPRLTIFNGYSRRFLTPVVGRQN